MSNWTFDRIGGLGDDLSCQPTDVNGTHHDLSRQFDHVKGDENGGEHPLTSAMDTIFYKDLYGPKTPMSIIRAKNKGTFNLWVMVLTTLNKIGKKV